MLVNTKNYEEDIFEVDDADAAVMEGGDIIEMEYLAKGAKIIELERVLSIFPNPSPSLCL